MGTMLIWAVKITATDPHLQQTVIKPSRTFSSNLGKDHNTIDTQYMATQTLRIVNWRGGSYWVTVQSARRGCKHTITIYVLGHRNIGRQCAKIRGIKREGGEVGGECCIIVTDLPR